MRPRNAAWQMAAERTKARPYVQLVVGLLDHFSVGKYEGVPRGLYIFTSLDLALISARLSSGRSRYSFIPEWKIECLYISCCSVLSLGVLAGFSPINSGKLFVERHTLFILEMGERSRVQLVANKVLCIRRLLS